MKLLKKIFLFLVLLVGLKAGVPIVTIIDDTTATTTKDPVTFTFTWGETVTGFDSSDISVTGGTKGTLSGSGTNYTLEVTPNANIQEGVISVSIPEGAAISSDGNQSTASATVTQNYDTKAPTVSSVAISSATGIQNNFLNVGDVITASVTMSENVTVTGTPQLALSIGGTIVQANYSAGSGTSQLTFTYTILSTQTDTDGISIAANSLALNGGTIQDTVENVATITHSAVGANANYKVDTTVPTVSSVAISSASGVQNSFLNVGDVVTATVTMSEIATVTSTPQLTLNIGGTDVLADYSSGSGTTQLKFTYTIQAGQTDADGISIAANSLALNSGTITDLASNTATITHTLVGNSASYKVDTTAPLAPTIGSLSDTALKVGETTSFTLVFGESVSNLDATDFTVANGTVTISGSGANYTVTFTPTVNNESSSNTIVLNTGNITDLSGNALVSGVTSTTFGIDTLPPTVTISSTTSGYSDGAYSTDNYINKNESNATFTIVGSTTNLATGANVHINYSGTDYNVTTDANGNFSHTISASDMLNHSTNTVSDSLIIHVTDNAGNTATPATKIFTVDLESTINASYTQQKISLSGKTNGFSISGNTDIASGLPISLTFNGNTYSNPTVNGTSWNISIPSVDIANLADGQKYDINISKTLKDIAGNIAVTTDNFIIYDEITDYYYDSKAFDLNASTSSNIHDEINGIQDNDYFKIILPSRGFLTLSIGSDKNISLYNTNNVNIIENTNTINKVLGTGTYYIKVNGTAGSYTLTNTFTPFEKEIDAISSIRFDVNTSASNISGIEHNATHNGYTYERNSTTSFIEIKQGKNIIYTLDKYKADYFFIKGNMLYTVSSTSGMVVYDISDETRIYVVGIKSNANNNISSIDDRYIYDGTNGGVDIRQDFKDTMPTSKMTLNIFPLNKSVSMNNWAGEIDTDIFKVVLEKSGTLGFVASNQLNGNDLNITVSKNSDFSSPSLSDFNTIVSLSAGTYYVKIVGNANTVDGKYDLIANFTTTDDKIDKVQNYSISPVSDITLDGSANSTSGNLLTDNDVDLYKIKVASSGILELNSTGYTVSLIQVNPNNNDDFTTEINQSIGYVESGVYYIKVSGTAGDYTIATKFTQDIPDSSTINVSNYDALNLGTTALKDFYLNQNSGEIVYINSETNKTYLYDINTKSSKEIIVNTPYNYTYERASINDGNLTLEYSYAAAKGSMIVDVTDINNSIILTNNTITTLTPRTKESVTINGTTYKIETAKGVLVYDSNNRYIRKITNIQKPDYLYSFGEKLFIVGEGKIAIVDVSNDYSDYKLEANAIYVGTTTTGTVVTKDIDVFSIMINGTGDFNITGLSNDINCTLSDANGSFSQSCNSQISNLSSGLYFISLVNNDTSKITQYSFTPNLTYDDYLDTMNFDTNTTHIQVVKDVNVSGNIVAISDKDFFKIEISETSQLSIDNLPAGFIGKVYFEGGDEVTKVDGKYDIFKAGMYYISIESNGTATGDYSFIPRLITGSALAFTDNASAQNKYLSFFQSNGEIKDIKVFGKYIYMTDTVDGFIVLDISDPENPQIATKYQTLGTARNILIDGSFAYISQGESGIEIFDISDKKAIKYIGGYDTNGTAYETDINSTSKILYVADGENGIVKLDISNPSKIVALKTITEADNNISSLKLINGKLVVADYKNGLKVYSDDSANSKIEALTKTGSKYTKVLNNGDYIYVSNDKTLSVYDKNLTKQDSIAINYEIQNIAYVDDLVYVTTASNVAVINVRNKTQIINEKEFSQIKNGEVVAGEMPILAIDNSKDNLFYAQNQKLHILELSPDYADNFKEAQNIDAFPNTQKGQIVTSRPDDKDIFKITTKYSGYLNITSSSMGVNGKVSFYNATDSGMANAIAQEDYKKIDWTTINPKETDAKPLTKDFSLTNVTVNKGTFYVVVEDALATNKTGGNYQLNIDFNTSLDKYADGIYSDITNSIASNGGVIEDSLFGDGGDIDFIDINVSSRVNLTFALSGAVKPRITIFYPDGTQANISTDENASSFTTELSSGNYKIRFDGYKATDNGSYKITLSTEPVDDIMVENGLSKENINTINDMNHLGNNIYVITKNTISRYNHLLEKITTKETNFIINNDENNSKNNRIFTYVGDEENSIVNYVVATNNDGLQPIIFEVSMSTLDTEMVRTQQIATNILPYLEVKYVSKNKIIYMYDGSNIQVRNIYDSNNGNMYSYSFGNLQDIKVVSYSGYDIAYIVSSSGKLEILKIMTGTISSTVLHTNYSFSKINSILVDTKSNRLFMGVDKKIIAYSLANISNPTEQFRLSFEGKEYEGTPSDMYAKDNRLYAIIPSVGIVVVDITDISAITYKTILNLGKDIDNIFSADDRTINYTNVENGTKRLKMYFFEDTFSDGQSDGVYSGMDETAPPKEGCFIATAAFGSYFEQHVKVLRDFRDHVLLTNFIGRELVKIYYEYSPSIAEYIANSESLKLVVRVVLTPVVYLIKYPLYAMLLILLLLFARRKFNNKGVIVR